MRTRVKICGITRATDAQAAVAAGADAVGFVFYRPSPRYLEPAAAAAIIAALPPFVSAVGLFVDAEAADVRAVLEVVPLSVLQFHGAETPAFCAAYGRPYIKAVRMHPDVVLADLGVRYATAAALLVDSYADDRPGGTGVTFDWSRLPAVLNRPLILAGGLTADNVGAAVVQVRPYAVDVSGGVEGRVGIKDARRMTEFCAQVRAGDARKAP
ncbi:MAG: phosphoribosylanthranilate isomerase [Acidiferrobacter sp.]